VGLPDCGHNITLDNPAGFVEAVLAAEAASTATTAQAA
jgi:pimeloyl-ACP methyl ester carboxylesterase